MTIDNAPATHESKGVELVGYHHLDDHPAFKIALQRAHGRYYLYVSHF